MNEHLLLIRKDLGKDCLVAIPKNKYYSDIDKAFYLAGELNGISKDNFEKHDHWGFYCAGIDILGRLERPCSNVFLAVKQMYEGVAGLEGFDAEGFAKDKKIKEDILNYEIVKGDFYVLRFTGRNLFENKFMQLSRFLLVSPNDGEPVLKDSHKSEIIVNGIQYNIDEKNLGYLTRSNDYEGSLKLTKTGSAKIQRKVLNPYVSTGTFGSKHTNGPWIIWEPELKRTNLECILTSHELNEGPDKKQ